ncbi:MAG: ATP-binding cassette domain-containing protein [Streptosporangiaceae bacterium]
MAILGPEHEAGPYAERRPVVDAVGVGMRAGRKRVFSGVAFRAAAGDLVAVAGPGGSGRTSLLLTVAGRMRPFVGELRVCGRVLPGGAAEVRRRVAVASAGGAAELQPELRISDHVRERLLTLRFVAPDAFDDACAVLGLDVPAGTRVGDLAPAQASRLALALALLGEPEVIIMDDLDSGADGPAQQELWWAARRVAASGPAVLAVTTDPAPAEGVADTFVLLDGRRGAAEPEDR